MSLFEQNTENTMRFKFFSIIFLVASLNTAIKAVESTNGGNGTNACHSDFTPSEFSNK